MSLNGYHRVIGTSFWSFDTKYCGQIMQWPFPPYFVKVGWA